MDFHSSLISFCHFSIRLSVSQAVCCISVFVSKNGRSSSLPRKQLNWPLSSSQEQLCSPLLSLFPVPSCVLGRVGSPHRTACSVPRRSELPVPWVSLVAKGSSCSRVPFSAVPVPQQGHGLVAQGARLALGSVALGGDTQHPLPWLPTCPGHSSVRFLCISTQNQHHVHVQHSSLE